MASDKQAILIDIDESASETHLDFQEFDAPTSSNPKTYDFSQEQKSTLDGNEGEPKYSLWSLEYFQRFFDVNTETVVSRIKGSMWPTPGINYLQHHIQSKPDLYGPFWICITLVFTIAISGNMANYLQAAAYQKYHWKYDFHAVSASATAIFLYSWVLPVLLWALLKFQGAEHFQLSILELICIYGYSLSVYVPISILWVIQVNFIQWLLVFVGAAVSGYVLITSIKPAFGDKNFIYLLVVACLHILLAVGFMLHFFHVPPMQADTPLTNTVQHESVNKTGSTF